MPARGGTRRRRSPSSATLSSSVGPSSSVVTTRRRRGSRRAARRSPALGPAFSRPSARPCRENAPQPLPLRRRRRAGQCGKLAGAGGVERPLFVPGGAVPFTGGGGASAGTTKKNKAAAPCFYLAPTRASRRVLGARSRRRTRGRRRLLSARSALAGALESWGVERVLADRSRADVAEATAAMPGPRGNGRGRGDARETGADSSGRRSLVVRRRATADAAARLDGRERHRGAARA